MNISKAPGPSLSINWSSPLHIPMRTVLVCILEMKKQMPTRAVFVWSHRARLKDGLQPRQAGPCSRMHAPFRGGGRGLSESPVGEEHARHWPGSKSHLLVFMGMEKAMAPPSSTLAWKIPWMEEPGGLQSMGSHRVGHDWVTSLSLFTFMHWRRKWQPTPVFLPGESQGRGSLLGCRLWGCTESDTTEAT